MQDRDDNTSPRESCHNTHLPDKSKLIFHTGVSQTLESNDMSDSSDDTNDETESKGSKHRQKKKTWTTEEDTKLRRLVSDEGTSSWVTIAKSLPGRSGKQCRERWYNKLDPSIKKTRWTAEEDEMVIRLHKHLGNRWAEIARQLHGRPSNTIKNRWHSHLKRKYELMEENKENEYQPDSPPTKRRNTSEDLSLSSSPQQQQEHSPPNSSHCTNRSPSPPYSPIHPYNSPRRTSHLPEHTVSRATPHPSSQSTSLPSAPHQFSDTSRLPPPSQPEFPTQFYASSVHPPDLSKFDFACDPSSQYLVPELLYQLHLQKQQIQQLTQIAQIRQQNVPSSGPGVSSPALFSPPGTYPLPHQFHQSLNKHPQHYPTPFRQISLNQPPQQPQVPLVSKHDQFGYDAQTYEQLMIEQQIAFEQLAYKQLENDQHQPIQVQQPVPSPHQPSHYRTQRKMDPPYSPASHQLSTPQKIRAPPLSPHLLPIHAFPQSPHGHHPPSLSMHLQSPHHKQPQVLHPALPPQSPHSLPSRPPILTTQTSHPPQLSPHSNPLHQQLSKAVTYQHPTVPLHPHVYPTRHVRPVRQPSFQQAEQQQYDEIRPDRPAIIAGTVKISEKEQENQSEKVCGFVSEGHGLGYSLQNKESQSQNKFYRLDETPCSQLLPDVPPETLGPPSQSSGAPRAYTHGNSKPPPPTFACSPFLKPPDANALNNFQPDTSEIEPHSTDTLEELGRNSQLQKGRGAIELEKEASARVQQRGSSSMGRILAQNSPLCPPNAILSPNTSKDLPKLSGQASSLEKLGRRIKIHTKPKGQVKLPLSMTAPSDPFFDYPYDTSQFHVMNNASAEQLEHVIPCTQHHTKQSSSEQTVPQQFVHVRNQRQPQQEKPTLQQTRSEATSVRGASSDSTPSCNSDSDSMEHNDSYDSGDGTDVGSAASTVRHIPEHVVVHQPEEPTEVRIVDVPTMQVTRDNSTQVQMLSNDKRDPFPYPPKITRPDLACNEALPPSDTDFPFSVDPFSTFFESSLWDSLVGMGSGGSSGGMGLGGLGSTGIGGMDASQDPNSF